MNEKAKEWLNLAYPTIAMKVARTGDPIKMTVHALQKWRMLRPEILKKYGLFANKGAVFCESTGEVVLMIDGTSCAFCRYEFAINKEDTCKKCPLFVTLGHDCDDLMRDGEGPYVQFLLTNDPEPMIEALEQTLERLKPETIHEA